MVGSDDITTNGQAQSVFQGFPRLVGWSGNAMVRSMGKASGRGGFILGDKSSNENAGDLHAM